MSELLLKNVEEQFIDQYGKVQILYYENLCLITSPLPPMSDNIPLNKTIIYKTICSKKLEFIV